MADVGVRKRHLEMFEGGQWLSDGILGIHHCDKIFGCRLKRFFFFFGSNAMDKCFVTYTGFGLVSREELLPLENNSSLKWKKQHVAGIKVWTY